jgi:hypothetical protein
MLYLEGPTPEQFEAAKAVAGALTRRLDFCWTTPGEVLVPSMPCDGGTWDDNCGCRRSWGGLTSCVSTTVGIVQETKTGIGGVAQSKYVLSWSKYNPDFVKGVMADLRTISDTLKDLRARPGDVIRLHMTDDSMTYFLQRNSAPSRRKVKQAA